MKQKVLYFLLFIMIALGCKTQSEDTSTYFGGKIINPKTDYVVLFQMEKAIDTFYLDANRRFIEKLDIQREGLYYFKHGPEHQYIYIEPQDSILIRLNTWDFDESLVFSGKGAERNNTLLNCFLEAEEDEKRFYSYYKFSPELFTKKIDSTKKVKLTKWSDFNKRNLEETTKFKKILKIAFTYPIYSKTESYPFHLNKSDLKKFLKESNGFYKHRDSVQINKDSLIYFHSYRDFLVSHMYNLVFTKHPDENIYSNIFTTSLLKVIDKKVNTKKAKNTFLRQTILSYFYRNSNKKIDKKVFETFFEFSSNENDKQQMQRLLKDASILQDGNSLDNFQLVDFNSTVHESSKLLKGKKALIYFWNPTYVTKEYVASKIKYFKNKYPQIQYIGVKIDGDSNDYIKELDIKTQFFITPKSKANNFLTSKMPRTILINKKGVITHNYTSLSSKDIYTQLKKLSKN